MCGIDCAHRFISAGRPKCRIPAPCRLIRYDRSRRARVQLDGSAPIVLLVDLGHLPPMPELAQAAVLSLFSEDISVSVREENLSGRRAGVRKISD